MPLELILVPGGDDTIRLTLNKRDLAVGLNDNVHCFTSGVGADDTLNSDDLASEGVLGAEGVHGEADFFEFQGDIIALDLQF